MVRPQKRQAPLSLTQGGWDGGGDPRLRARVSETRGPRHMLGQDHGDWALVLARGSLSFPTWGSQIPSVEAYGTTSLASSFELCPPTAP